MGTQIGKLLIKCRHEIEYSHLYRKKIGIDAYNMIYAFLAPIRTRQTGGGYLTDANGNVTSHLSGLFYRMTNLLPYRIRPVFIFDGEPPIFKEKEIEIRKKRKNIAEIKRNDAIARGDLEEALKHAQATSRITSNMIEDAKKLLNYFGIPIIQAVSEAEAQGAFMVREGTLNAMASQDYDAFLFGSPEVIRNLTITRRRRVPSQSRSIELIPEKVILTELLDELKLGSRDQLIMLGLLVGTDYNPKGIKGIGPKTALKLVHKYRTPDSLLEYLNVNFSLNEVFPYPPNILLDYFRTPEVEKGVKIIIKKPQPDKITEFLVEERDFNKDRIEKQLETMFTKTRKIKQKLDQKSLEKFF
ncbi:MAG: flap endonuclease-1 [Candidatus Hodarchaeota archaeon]